MTYSPKNKIVVASSTEGLLWDGAKECFLAAHNALMNNNEMYRVQTAAPFDHVIEPAEFKRYMQEFVSTEYFGAALKLRPLVRKAWHYFTVLGMIKRDPEGARKILADPGKEEAYRGFIKKFSENTASTSSDMQEKWGKIFYGERERMQAADMFSWLDLYEPIGSRWEELGKLAETKKLNENGEAVSGFLPALATAKDEDSSSQLCAYFVKTKKLDGRHYSAENADACTIPRKLIVGIGAVPSGRKADQLSALKNIAGVPKTQVWNLNDMYSVEELDELFMENFRYNFFLRGNVFPFDVERAKNDPMVTVLGENFAEQLGRAAEDMGL